MGGTKLTIPLGWGNLTRQSSLVQVVLNEKPTSYNWDSLDSVILDFNDTCSLRSLCTDVPLPQEKSREGRREGGRLYTGYGLRTWWNLLHKTVKKDYKSTLEMNLAIKQREESSLPRENAIG